MKKILLFFFLLIASMLTQAQQIMDSAFVNVLAPINGKTDSANINISADTTIINGILKVTGEIVSNSGSFSVHDSNGGLQIVTDISGLTLAGGQDSTVYINLGTTITINGPLQVTDSANLNNVIIQGDLGASRIISDDTISADVGVFTGNVHTEGDIIFDNDSSFLGTWGPGNFNFKAYTHNVYAKSSIGCYDNAVDEMGTFIELAPGDTGSIFFGNSVSQGPLAKIDASGNITAKGGIITGDNVTVGDTLKVSNIIPVVGGTSITSTASGVSNSTSIVQDTNSVTITADSIHLVGNVTGALPYKVYTALLTQRVTIISEGVLEIGEIYQIDAINQTDDFSNVGYVTPGVPFIATATTPTVWVNYTQVIDVNKLPPTAIILENTLGEVPTFTYQGVGNYRLHVISPILIEEKTWIMLNNAGSNSSRWVNNIYSYDENALDIESIDDTDAHVDQNLYYTAIEIRVYP